MKVLLFDIDGTLLKVGTASKRAFDIAFEEQFSTIPIKEGVTFHGATDPQIHDQIAIATMGRKLNHEERSQLNKRYIELLPSEIEAETGYRIMPGVEELLSQLHQREDVALGLQTGNLKDAANYKLAHGNLARYFSFGGFGSDSGDRAEIVSIAVERAQSYLGKSIIEDIAVIGDTPRDIQAGKRCGARTVAVATGIHSKKTLKAENPDYVFSDLSAIDVFRSLVNQ